MKRCSASDGKEQKDFSPIFLTNVVDLYEHSNKVSADSTVINSCCEKNQRDRECSVYILRAVIAHHDSSPHVGHYSTIIYIKEIMFTLDGSSIHERTTPEKVRLETDAYILLYERFDIVADMEEHNFSLLSVIS